MSDVQIIPIDAWVEGLCALPPAGFASAVNRYLDSHRVDPGYSTRLVDLDDQHLAGIVFREARGLVGSAICGMR